MATILISAAKLANSSTSIPAEIVTEEILPKLPAKSLVRFKCVSKSFNTLISSPKFIDTQLRQSLSSDDNRLLILAGKDYTNLSSIDLDSLEPSTITKIPFPRTLGESLTGHVSIVGSVNGLLCIIPSIFHHVVINPSTGVYKIVPTGGRTFGGQQFHVSFGFGFDEVNNDYKIVKITEFKSFLDYSYPDHITGRDAHVYSLKENVWKWLGREDTPQYSVKHLQNCVVLNKLSHLLHWVVWTTLGIYGIYCFDVSREAWVNEVPLMDDLGYTKRVYGDDSVHHPAPKNRVWDIQLGVLDENLSLLVCDIRKYHIVWIMKEYGVKKSWTRLYVVPHINVIGSHLLSPTCYCRGSKRDEFLHVVAGMSQLFWYNTLSQTANWIRIQGCPEFSQAHMFKGSLVSIPGGVQSINSKRQNHGVT